MVGFWDNLLNNTFYATIAYGIAKTAIESVLKILKVRNSVHSHYPTAPNLRWVTYDPDIE